MSKNEDLYKQVEKITDTIRKRTVRFYGHLFRIRKYPLKNLNYNTKMKATIKWVEETRKDIEEIGINPEEISNKVSFQMNVDEFKAFQEK